MSTITVVATVEATNSPPRVRLDLTDIGTPNLFSATVNRLDPDGRLVPVRTADGAPLLLTTSGINRVGTVYDYEMPYGQIVQYTTVEDPTSSSGDVMVPVADIWLVHPGVPSLSQAIELRAGSLEEEQFSSRQGVFYAMGRANPIIVTSGSRNGMQSTLLVATDTLNEVSALRNLVADSGILLLNIPAAMGLGVDTSYIAVSDVSVRRVSDIGQDPQRTVVMPFTVVDRPSGGSQSQRTLLDLLTYPTLNSLMTSYSSFNDMLAGP
jgi:hypothetical protein